MRKLSIYTLLITACIMSLSGCGQKGPLFLTEVPETQIAEPVAEEASEEETQKKKDPPAE